MDAVWIPLLLSLKVAGWATLLNAILGVAAAYALARWRSRARDVVDAILTLRTNHLDIGMWLLKT
ncbi:UNVERIFIED_CONTAM: hypothetical protein OHV15_17075 [Microbacterium sp. SLM126]